ncbi:hypothetical protein [Brevibacillus borstelensis]|uniref:hypothetical protein n=1 Tax=Brevibacillus borstelensis TaxID=45462 RepID=UPI003D240A26
MLLKDSPNKKDIQALSVQLWNELQETDENYAESYLTWCIEKLRTNKAHQKEQTIRRNLNRKNLTQQDRDQLTRELQKVKHKDHPKNITKGDIVHVKFGVNLGDELSDLDGNYKIIDGHYAIVLGQKGFMFHILPLTSQPQRLNDPDLEIFFEGLALPGGYDKSHLAFAKMQFIHIRRIKRIHGIPEGKKRLTDEQLKILDEKLSKLMALKAFVTNGESAQVTI